jgi:hypothetical protein
MLHHDQFSSVLVSEEHVKRAFFGLTVGSPPVGDARFAESFNSIGLQYFRYESSADIIPHLLDFLHGKEEEVVVSDSSLRAAKELVDTLKRMPALRKLHRAFVVHRFEHVGTRFNMKDLTVSASANHKGGRMHFRDFMRHATRIHRSHKRESYVSELKRFFGLLDNPEDFEKYLYPGDQFRLYHYATKKYCLLEDFKHSPFALVRWSAPRLTCGFDKDQADQRPFRAYQMSDHKALAKYDLSPISFASDIAIIDPEFGNYLTR